MRFIYNHHTSGVRRSPEVVERQYWENVRKCGEDDCWLWSGRVSADGYAMMGHKTKASHFAMTLDGRPRPVAKQANHTCDTPACVNPRHLYWGTQLENIADMKARGRQRNGASR